MLRLAAAVAGVLLLAALPIKADARIDDWVGEYAMNHDGFQGTLRIQDSKRDCAAPAWCHLVISYIDAKGVRIPAAIRTIDQAFQHMLFDIAFQGNRQPFHGYLMSWDKSRMAGTTAWQGRTFGFYAVKRENIAAVPPLTPPIRPGRGRGGTLTTPDTQASNRKKISADGQVETTMPDGSRRLERPGVCGFTVVRPDGTKTGASCNQVQPATPPVPDHVSATWLDAHGSSLLEIARSLLGNDQTSVDNYLRTESAGLTVYDRIRLRTDLIAKLTF